MGNAPQMIPTVRPDETAPYASPPLRTCFSSSHARCVLVAALVHVRTWQVKGKGAPNKHPRTKEAGMGRLGVAAAFKGSLGLVVIIFLVMGKKTLLLLIQDPFWLNHDHRLNPTNLH